MTVTQPAPRSADTTALAALERAMGELRDAHYNGGMAREWEATKAVLTAYDAWREAAKIPAHTTADQGELSLREYQDLSDAATRGAMRLKLAEDTIAAIRKALDERDPARLYDITEQYDAPRSAGKAQAPDTKGTMP